MNNRGGDELLQLLSALGSLMDSLGFLDILAIGLASLALGMVLLVASKLVRRIERLEQDVLQLRAGHPGQAGPQGLAMPAAGAFPAAAAAATTAPAASATAAASAQQPGQPAQAAPAADAGPTLSVFQQAARLLQQGVPLADAAAACGLSRTEIELAARLGSIPTGSVPCSGGPAGNPAGNRPGVGLRVNRAA